MNAIKEIEDRLQKYPQARSEVKGSRITVFPVDENGFNVSLEEDSSGYTVFFDGWHAHYEGAEEAMNVFAFGLSEECRLKMTYRGRFAYVWTVDQRHDDGTWVPCEWIGLNEVRLLALPLFWLRERHVYLQNDLIKHR